MKNLKPPAIWSEVGYVYSSWNLDDLPSAISDFSVGLKDKDREALIEFLDQVLDADLRSDQYAKLFKETGGDLWLRPIGDRKQAWFEYFSALRENIQ